MKEAIIDNVEQYAAEELAKFIMEGVVTYEELVNETDGGFSAVQRRNVKELLKANDAKAWAEVQEANTIAAAQQYLDTYVNGKYREQARQLMAEIEERAVQDAAEAREAADWEAVDKNSVDDLREYIENNPGGAHVAEAERRVDSLLTDEIMGEGIDALKDKIKEIETDNNRSSEQKDNSISREIEGAIADGKIKKQDFLDALSQDHNLVGARVVKRLVDNSTIAVDDLKRVGVDVEFIRKMKNAEPKQAFKHTQPFDRIHKRSTEVYFWGIPSSGKSCALGAILSVAKSGKVAHSLDADTDSQGYGYMMWLSDLFDDAEEGCATLMTSTYGDAFYEMGFDLVDKSEKYIHPITCIDMAGELMRCMYLSKACMDLSDDQLEMLETMTNVLIANRTGNRKMHIFVVEYGAEGKMHEGISQHTYLEGAVSYIKDTGIFKKDTDAVVLMVTKVDKAGGISKEKLKEYVVSKYRNFYNGLERICKDNEINRGKVEIVPFTLGEVCFQYYCKFNPKPAENVVRIILDRSAKVRIGRLGRLSSIFKG